VQNSTYENSIINWTLSSLADHFKHWFSQLWSCQNAAKL